jgi:SAM-dependent methyltransferase
MDTMTPEMGALKARLRDTWMAGDYGHFATYMLPGALEFYRELHVGPGMKVLDVACGAGQLSLPAARDGADVTGIDLAANLVEQAQARAAAEGLDIRFEEGDAEQLPYPDASFDLVHSFIGAMFAPRPERVAAELLRVCRPGGRIAMGNWTPEGFVGQMFKTHGKHVPPSPLMTSPVLWGKEEVVRERFGDGVRDLRLTRKMFPFRYPFPPAEVVEFFRTYYGPSRQAFAALDADGQAALRQDLEALWTTSNVAEDGTTQVMGEYLEVLATRV